MQLAGRNESDVVGAAAAQAHAIENRNTHAQAGARKPNLVLATSTVRAHTLIPTGELDRRSAPVLEAEIERLYEQGITALTLDMRELTYIDSIGIASIAFRCGLCKRRGNDLALIPGSRLMRRALERAGVTDLVTLGDDRIAITREPAGRPEDQSRDPASSGR